LTQDRPRWNLRNIMTQLFGLYCPCPHYYVLGVGLWGALPPELFVEGLVSEVNLCYGFV